MAGTVKYTKKQLLRNRIVFGLACVLFIAFIVFCIWGIVQLFNTGTYPKGYSEQGPTAYGGEQYLTGRDVYDFTSPVPESPRANISDFENALFVGGTHMSGFASAYHELTVIYNVNASILNGVDGKFTSSQTGETATLYDRLLNRTYDSIYLHFGLNEMTLPNITAVNASYRALVERIKAIAPEINIYLCTVLPVTAAQDEKAASVSNANAEIINGYIREIAAEYEIFLLDIAAPYTDENGCLKEEYASSGFYIKTGGYAPMYDYILTHIPPDYVA